MNRDTPPVQPGPIETAAWFVAAQPGSANRLRAGARRRRRRGSWLPRRAPDMIDYGVLTWRDYLSYHLAKRRTRRRQRRRARHHRDHRHSRVRTGPGHPPDH